MRDKPELVLNKILNSQLLVINDRLWTRIKTRKGGASCELCQRKYIQKDRLLWKPMPGWSKNIKRDWRICHPCIVSCDQREVDVGGWVTMKQAIAVFRAGMVGPERLWTPVCTGEVRSDWFAHAGWKLKATDVLATLQRIQAATVEDELRPW